MATPRAARWLEPIVKLKIKFLRRIRSARRTQRLLHDPYLVARGRVFIYQPTTRRWTFEPIAAIEEFAAKAIDAPCGVGSRNCVACYVCIPLYRSPRNRLLGRDCTFHIARAREEAEALRYLQSIKLDTGYLARLEERRLIILSGDDLEADNPRYDQTDADEA